MIDCPPVAICAQDPGADAPAMWAMRSVIVLLTSPGFCPGLLGVHAFHGVTRSSAKRSSAKNVGPSPWIQEPYSEATEANRSDVGKEESGRSLVHIAVYSEGPGGSEVGGWLERCWLPRLWKVP